MELRGRRYKRNWMRANQAIYRVGGGVEVFRTEVQLHFYDVGAYWGGSYWKVHNPLSMEIWSLDDDRRPLDRVRTGPKVFYCLRDLERTKPMSALAGPPRTTPAATRTRAGSGCGSAPRSAGRTSTPPTTTASGSTSAGLRGCFAFVMRVDPQNLLYESNENDNRSVRIVRLPYHAGPQHC